MATGSRVPEMLPMPLVWNLAVPRSKYGST